MQDNVHACTALHRALSARAARAPNIPSTLAQEQSYNPFLRAKHSPFQTMVQTSDKGTKRQTEEQLAVKIFAKLRQLKDDFQPTEDSYQRAIALAQQSSAAASL